MKKFVRAQTVKRWKQLRQQIRRTAQKPADADAIHDVRVAIRRFLACLRTFAPFFEPRQVKKVRKPLRKLLKRCGEVRNRDIAIALLRGLPVVAILERQRSQAQQPLIEQLRRAHREITGPLPLEVHGAPQWQPGLPQQVSEFFARGRTAAAAGATPAAMHRFRLLAKRLRYALEILQFLPGTPRAATAAALTLMAGLQDRLGAINDCVTARSLVRRNRAAVARLDALLAARKAAFQRYWKAQFGPGTGQRWRAMAARIDEIACKSTS